ncbi:hypothetical protein SGRIM128S_08411 [Streptomyces griseomycini]
MQRPTAVPAPRHRARPGGRVRRHRPVGGGPAARRTRRRRARASRPPRPSTSRSPHPSASPPSASSVLGPRRGRWPSSPAPSAAGAPPGCGRPTRCAASSDARPAPDPGSAWNSAGLPSPLHRGTHACTNSEASPGARTAAVRRPSMPSTSTGPSPTETGSSRDHGGGKSTLLQMLGGLDRPSSGEIVLDDRPGQVAEARLTRGAAARHFGFVFQSFNLILMLIPRRERRDRARAARAKAKSAGRRQPRRSRRSGSAKSARHLPGEMSGGSAAAGGHRAGPGGGAEGAARRGPTGNLYESTRDEIMDVLVRMWKGAPAHLRHGPPRTSAIAEEGPAPGDDLKGRITVRRTRRPDPGAAPRSCNGNRRRRGYSRPATSPPFPQPLTCPPRYCDIRGGRRRVRRPPPPGRVKVTHPATPLGGTLRRQVKRACAATVATAAAVSRRGMTSSGGCRPGTDGRHRTAVGEDVLAQGRPPASR